MEEVERVKARQRQESGVRQDSAKGRTDSIVAQETGFGSRTTYNQAKFIADHADEDTIRALDEEKTTISRAYEETKAKLREAEERAERLTKNAPTATFCRQGVCSVNSCYMTFVQPLVHLAKVRQCGVISTVFECIGPKRLNAPTWHDNTRPPI